MKVRREGAVRWCGRRRGFRGGVAAVPLLAAMVLVAAARPGGAAVASHDPWRLARVRAEGVAPADAAGRCEACHMLVSSENDPDTSWISKTARTLQFIKLYRGVGTGTSSRLLACTFCHTSMLDNTVMEDALSEFATTTVKHPMGRKIDGSTDTFTEWLSTLDSPSLPDELQCVDCHLAELLAYPGHEGRTTDPSPWTGTWDAAVNPFALRNVSAAGDGDKRHCLETCHGSLGVRNSPTRPKMGHYVWGRFDGETLYDPTGLPLRVAGSACLRCHDAHSSTKTRLTQDGLKRGRPDPGRVAIDETACVAVCHAADAFATHGHGGKTGISAVNCTPCHVASIPHRDQTDDASRRRMSYLDPVKGSLTRNLAADRIDNEFKGARDANDRGEATFAYSKTANCRTCHINYPGHGGAARATSCLDCHDVHGSDAARNGNAAMIRSTVYGEDTVFTAADRAARVYFRAAAPNGICDNDACHVAAAGDLSAAHAGGVGEVLGRPCRDCHRMTHGAKPNSEDSFK